jgi:nucleoside permease NupC
MKHYLLAALLMAALASCTMQQLAQPTKHHQRINQRSRDRNLHHDQKIYKRNFFDM